jgi:hypothetical protein
LAIRERKEEEKKIAKEEKIIFKVKLC